MSRRVREERDLDPVAAPPSSRTGRSPATWPGRDGIRSPAGAARTRRRSCPCSLRTQASDKAGEDGAIRNLAHIWPDPRPSKADVSSYPVKFGDDPLNPRQISIRQRQINNMPDTIAHGIDRGGPSARSTTYALVHFGHRSLVTSTDADETGQSPRGSRLQIDPPVRDSSPLKKATTSL